MTERTVVSSSTIRMPTVASIDNDLSQGLVGMAPFVYRSPQISCFFLLFARLKGDDLLIRQALRGPLHWQVDYHPQPAQ